MTEEQIQRRRETDRERKARKRAAERQLAKQKQAEIEKATESAMQVSLEITYSNEKQPGQLMSDAAFHDYLDRQNRRK